MNALFLAPFLLLLAAAAASAQTIYSKVDVEGHPMLADRQSMASESHQDAASAGEAPATPVRRYGVAKPRAVAINIREAERRLLQAQQKRQEGLEPLPGELNPDTGQPTFRYWKRQEKLRLLVEVAQRRLIATHRPQLAKR